MRNAPDREYRGSPICVSLDLNLALISPFNISKSRNFEILKFPYIMKIITIGSATRDCIIPSKDFQVKKTEIKNRNNQNAIVLPLGDKIELSQIQFSTGGGATNTAYTFSRQGFNTSCLAKIATDSRGKQVLKDLNEENIGTELIQKTTSSSTAYSITLLTEQGRTILVHRGTSGNLRRSNIESRKMRANWFYITSLGGKMKVLKKIIDIASDRGIEVALNPGELEIEHRSNLKQLLSQVTVLILNKEEALQLAQTETIKKAFQNLSEAAVTVITKGKEGSEVVADKKRYKAGIFREEKFVDRTGAGDAFGSGFVSGFIHQGENPFDTQCIKEAIKLGSANSTAIVEHLGAKDNILSKQKYKEENRWDNFEIETKEFKAPLV